MQADPSASPHAGLRGPLPAYAQNVASDGTGSHAHGAGLAHANHATVPGGAGGVQHANPHARRPMQQAQGQAARTPSGAVALRHPAAASTAPRRALSSIVTGQYLPTGDAGIDRMRKLEFALKLHGSSC